MQENVYKGFPISNWVAGAREIFADECVEMNPEDAARAGVEDGEEIVVSSAAFERKWRTRIVADQPEGSVHVTLRPNGWLGPNPHYVNMRKCDV
jgi:anaerobic selenocysteine-containing dehydrogenase